MLLPTSGFYVQNLEARFVHVERRVIMVTMVIVVIRVIMLIRVIRITSVKSSMGILTHQGHISKVNANAE